MTEARISERLSVCIIDYWCVLACPPNAAAAMAIVGLPATVAESASIFAGFSETSLTYQETCSTKLDDVMADQRRSHGK